MKKFIDSISPNTKIYDKLEEFYIFEGIKFHNWSYYAKDFLDKESHKKQVNRNNLSNVLYFKIGPTDFLFTGDAEKELGEAIASQKPDIFKNIDIYQVPHHGSKNSLNKSFFEKLNPENCYIPATYDEENTSWSNFSGAASHKFPDGNIIDQLKESGCQEIMTGKPYNGLTTSQLEKNDNTEVTITIYLDKNGKIIDKKYFKNIILNSL
ncbi:hypothetical protein [Spiroplasma endosymbiont of Poecilobothrus nobilitatus]|uniref:hypothetical protein n=1 Tax=Spiroplasma endosymbiont of Poecilobothrus nobilitatus TaxID=1209220 RepID=UPI00313F20B4